MKYPIEVIEDLVKVNTKSVSVDTLSAAYEYCERIAKSHYENFPVGSILIPKENRKYFYAVYAYSRLGDDIGDEHDFTSENRLALLSELKETISYYAENKESIGNNPIGLALADTIKAKTLPLETLFRLLDAFKMDINFRQPNDINDLFEYCHYSANPVGELVLRISGEYSEKTASISYKICTGLQLINFWQDISRDMKIGRNYLPTSLMNKYDIDLSRLESKDTDILGRVDKLLSELFAVTKELMSEGALITKFIRNRRLRAELSAIYLSANIVLRKCERLQHRLLFERPSLRKRELLSILPKVSLNLLKG